MEEERIYLDHAGATLASKHQLDEISKNLYKDISILGNPHSKHESGQNSASIIKQIKEKTLKMFGVNSDEYSVIFTKNTTDSLRISIESLNNLYKNKKMDLLMLKDSHTSLYGLRDRVDNIDFKLLTNLNGLPENIDIFLMTAMSNYSGKKYSKELIQKLKNINQNLITIIDIAALCGTSVINLHDYYLPEFVTFSFYKIFGFPTGIGCLLIKKLNIFNEKLNLKGFAGGNVVNYNVYTGQYAYRDDIEDRFDTGTPNYQGIALLKYGFDDIDYYGGMLKIQNHTYSLALNIVKYLKTTKHYNEQKIAEIYGWDEEDMNEQGPIINFNLLRSDGSYIGYSEVERMCELFNIEIRTGCFCNKGACDIYLNIYDYDVKDEIKTKKCGDEFDLLNGKPLGSCRVSFGRTSTLNDVKVFIKMIETCFLSSSLTSLSTMNSSKNFNNFGILTNIFIYPIKSCSPIETKKWRLTSSGLWLDRQFMFITNTGIILTQKKLPILCSIIPELIDNNTLLLKSKYDDNEIYQLSINNNNNNNDNNDNLYMNNDINDDIIKSTICINNLLGIECDNNINKWLKNLHSTIPDDIKLIRQLNIKCNEKNQLITFNNVADYLLITWSSINALSNILNLSSDVIMKRFRANFVIDTGNSNPFDEDNFKYIHIGGVGFKIIGKCTRCQMIAIDQDTGQKDPNVLLALRDLRPGDKITFGVYLQKITDNPVDIFVGNTIKINRIRKHDGTGY